MITSSTRILKLSSIVINLRHVAKMADGANGCCKTAGAPYELVDIGANLGHPHFKSDLNEVIQRAKDAGVIRIMVTGCNVKQSKEACDLAKQHPGYLYFTAGVHPHDAKEFTSDTLDTLRELSKEAHCVAIGECGLDFNRNFSPQDQQLAAFEKQKYGTTSHVSIGDSSGDSGDTVKSRVSIYPRFFSTFTPCLPEWPRLQACSTAIFTMGVVMKVELACAVQKPLFIHEREAHASMVEILTKFLDRLPPTVIHCFTGLAKEAQKYVEMGLNIGLTGFLWKDRSDDGVQFALRNGLIPLDRLVLETDAPFMYPKINDKKIPKEVSARISEHAAKFHKFSSFKRNEPCSLPATCELIAAFMDVSADKVGRKTTENAIRIYGL